MTKSFSVELLRVSYKDLVIIMSQASMQVVNRLHSQQIRVYTSMVVTMAKESKDLNHL